MVATPEETNPVPRIESIKQPKVPQVEKGVNNPDRLGPQRALDALSKTTPGIPDRLDLQNLAAAGETPKTPLEQRMEMAEGHMKTPFIGGESVDPTAMKVGETPQQAQERGWLTAMTRAKNAEGLSDTQKQGHLQEIVNAAKQAGVPPKAIQKHLEGLGISTARQQETASAQTSPTAEASIQASPPSWQDGLKNAYLAENRTDAQKSADMQKIIDAAKATGVPREAIRAYVDSLASAVQVAQAKKAIEQTTNAETPPNTTASGIAKFAERMRGSWGDAAVEKVFLNSVERALKTQGTPEEKQTYIQAEADKLKARGFDPRQIEAWIQRGHQNHEFKTRCNEAIKTLSTDDEKQAFIHTQVDQLKASGITPPKIKGMLNELGLTKDWIKSAGIDPDLK